MKFLLKSMLISVIILTTNNIIYSQIAPNKYFIRFTDKIGTPYSTSNPEQFLSQRAILRRQKQNILITQNDLPIKPDYIDSLKSLGLQIINKSKWFNGVQVYTLDTLLIDTISNLSFVESYAKSYYLKITEDNLKKHNRVVNLKNTKQTNDYYNYGAATNQITMLNGNVLHNQGFRGDSMIISIFDAGFFKVDSISAFDSLWNNNQIIGAKDFVDGDTIVWDASTHGLAVLSTIGSNLPGDFVGTAPKANFFLMRTEDTSSELVVEEYNWLSAAEFADSLGTDIITTSLGYTVFDNSATSHSYADMDGNTCVISIAADIAASKGILVVASAGNSGSSSWHFIGAPADADSALTIGAVNSAGNYASFSSTGPTYDGRIKPNVVAQGQGTTIIDSNGNVSAGNGTSFSCPIIAGLVACLWQASPNMSNMEIISAVEQSASQYNNPDSLLGYGIPNFAYANLILHGKDYKSTDKENLVNIYPNPFSHNISVDYYSLDTQMVNFDVYNILGSHVYSSKKDVLPDTYNEFNFDLSDLKSGIYFLNIRTKNKVFSKKIIKK